MVLGTSSLRGVRGETDYTFDDLKVVNDNTNNNCADLCATDNNRCPFTNDQCNTDYLQQTYYLENADNWGQYGGHISSLYPSGCIYGNVVFGLNGAQGSSASDNQAAGCLCHPADSPVTCLSEFTASDDTALTGACSCGDTSECAIGSYCVTGQPNVCQAYPSDCTALKTLYDTGTGGTPCCSESGGDCAIWKSAYNGQGCCSQ